MKSINGKIDETVTKYGMLRKNDKIVIALSGGPDSVCLFNYLVLVRAKYSLELFAAHVNHNLRGAESDGDERFCRDLCDRNGVPIFVLSADVIGESEKTGEGTEETARKIRYRFFAEICEKTGATKTALGHNADDVAETLILNMARGSGTKGLGSIRAVRDGIIRPLIELPKSEISDCLDKANISYCTDSTNLTDDYTRNKVRHNIIPLLKELNPSFLNAVSRLTAAASADDEYLTETANNLLTDDISKLKEMPSPIFDRVAALLFESQFGEKLDSGSVSRIASVVSGKARSTETVGGITAKAFGGKLVFRDGKKPEPFCRMLIDGENLLPDGRKITAEFRNGKKYVYNSTVDVIIKNDIIKGNLYARSRMTGDKIKIGGINRSVKKLMIDRKTEAYLRDRLIVIADDEKVYYIEQIGRSDMTEREK